MLGVYDYTVILTYLSAISACVGVLVSLSGSGHPYWGTLFLLICGLCDAFDGKVARTKKNRTEHEKKFGIQIDSMSDLLAFGVLPACIGNAMIRVWPTAKELPRIGRRMMISIPIVIMWAILLVYMLAVLIRLSHFNVAEEERQSQEAGNRKYFEGLPVTSAAMIFPTIMLLQYVLPVDITILYFGVIPFMVAAFLSKLKVPKPGTKLILAFIGFGLIEFIVLVVIWSLSK